MYRVEIISHYEELWRYNMIIMCGGYNTLSEQLYVVGCDRITSEEFQTGATTQLDPPPNYNPSEPLILECKNADSIHAIIYVIAHTLPEDRMVENSPPFALQVKIYSDEKELYVQEHQVNQWGGATINIKI